MIKLKSIGYQQDNVAATVEYDLEGETYSFTLYAKERIIYDMPLNEIEDYIRGRVTSERSSKLRGIVESKLNQLIDVDLEATT